MEKLYYCRESETLWTVPDLMAFYHENANDVEIEIGFDAWLNGCLYQNNGTLEEFKPLYTIGNCTVWNIKTDLE